MSPQLAAVLALLVLPQAAPPSPPAAGFTTPVLISDFTQPLATNWLGGCPNGADGSQVNTYDTTGHQWYLNLWWSNTNQACDIAQITDPVFGGTVLDIPWVANSYNQQVGATLQTAAWFSTDETTADHGITLPNNWYAEVVFRQAPIAPGSFGAFWTWPLLAMTDGAQSGLEHDIIELDTGNLPVSDSAYHNWFLNDFGPWVWEGYGPPGLPQGFDPTQYHTFSGRQTSDGTSAYFCAYIDGVFQQCRPSPSGFTATNAAARYFFLLQNACDWWNYPSNFCNTGLHTHMYVKSVKIWSCPDWQTTQCNGPVLTQ